MIDEIFAMIMKEARTRPGKDPLLNIYAVLMEIGARMLAAIDQIKQDKGRDTHHEN